LKEKGEIRGSGGDRGESALCLTCVIVGEWCLFDLVLSIANLLDRCGALSALVGQTPCALGWHDQGVNWETNILFHVIETLDKAVCERDDKQEHRVRV
jgi:hypothetical protein